MGFLGSRKPLPNVRAEQKWEYINLDDFHSTSCWTIVSYGILYVALFISIAVYVVDTITAVNLLAFRRWSGQIEPKIPLEYARWIFGGCIILSFVLLIFRWIRAVRVMRQGGVAQSYLDPLAVRVQSVRVGREGRGWKRFLVFAELTKGKKGASYIALLVYFSFEAWLRILLAEGPRQVINAFTLWELMNQDLIPVGDNAAEDGNSPFAQFWINVGVLAEKQSQLQAMVLFGMVFTLIVWVVTFVNLIVAVLLYLIFVMHHVPTSDGSLGAYCRRKMDASMERIVRTKVNKALRKENELREQQARQGHGPLSTRPTLPDMDSLRGPSPMATQTSLGQYSTRTPTDLGSARTGPGSLDRRPTMPDVAGSDFRPRPLVRTATQESAASWRSYDSSAPLMDAAGAMAGGPPRPAANPGMPTRSASDDSQPSLHRTYTGQSQSSQRSYGPNSRPVTPHGRPSPGLHRMPSQPTSPFTGRQTPVEPFSPISPYRAPSTAPGNPASGGVMSPTALQRAPTSNSQGGRAYTPTNAPSVRSMTPSTPYGSEYDWAPPPVPPLPRDASFASAGPRRN